MAISSFEHNVIIRDKDKIDEKRRSAPKCKRNMVSIKINIKTLQEVAEFLFWFVPFIKCCK